MRNKLLFSYISTAFGTLFVLQSLRSQNHFFSLDRYHYFLLPNENENLVLG